ncbi:hypothetical protein Ddye_028059 [Dipteronia dyeriana]|uniref:Uncharacterized protein n=1 Tax=Dipteronia dyeriana TaxID=168575 RepID=A0AAD9TR76_9ROSI|nr:hypothetical protein Ddye_028059 [Dipteronia dyeriana]
MIPAKFLSKIGIHELEIEGVKVKVSHVTTNFLCLITRNLPSSILNLLADKNICVEGCLINSIKRHWSNGRISFSISTSLSGVVEVGQLAARDLKMPNLSKCGLEELNTEVINSIADATALPDQTVCIS